MIVAVVVASLLLIAYCYVGYPLQVALLARWRARPVDARSWQPRIDVVMVVHNGASEIARKIDNVLSLDYPPELLRLRIGFDGCTDDSADRARSTCTRRPDGQRVSLAEFAQRRGKSACLADLVAASSADVIVFVDVRQRLEPQVARALVAPLADAGVGAVSGELMFEAIEGFGGSVDAYWRYEKFIRRNESASGSVVGVTGAIWAARRDALPTIPGGLVLDDVWIPLAIARKGLRIVFCPDAVAWDRPSSDVSHEEARKRRTLAGNYQLIARDPSLLWPPAHPLGWRLWGHKWLRLVSPWLFVLALLGNLAVAGSSPWLATLLALQLFCWLLAALGWAMPAWQRFLPLRIAALFARMNVFAAQALFDHLRDRDSHLWSSSRAESQR